MGTQRVHEYAQFPDHGGELDVLVRRESSPPGSRSLRSARARLRTGAQTVSLGHQQPGADQLPAWGSRGMAERHEYVAFA